MPFYKCHVWLTWDDWTPVEASSPGLPAASYHDLLVGTSYENHEQVFVLKGDEMPMVDQARVFYFYPKGKETNGHQENKT